MSSFVHAIGGVFQPILKLIAEGLALFFAIIPNYPVAVALLTIVVMVVLTPLTVKGTKNMAAMQALGPEMKKLQQKYKGPENRTQLNEEMMKLYKEHGVNPASGCLPMLLQMPFFFMLYSVIKGVTNTVAKGAKIPYTLTSTGINPNRTSVCHLTACSEPRYIASTSKMYYDIVTGHGQLVSWGINFAAKLLSHHSSPFVYIPYSLLVLGAVGLQYLQMARLNARNPQASQANPQAAMLQKYMPLIFGFIYLNVAAILNVYFIFSSAIRIGTQEVLFRRGMVPGSAGAGGTAPRPSSSKASGVESTERALPKADSGSGNGKGTPGKTSGTGTGTPGKASGTGTNRSGASASRSGPGSAKGGSGKGPGTAGGGAASNGNGTNSDNGSTGAAAAKQHPRSKTKRERKAR